MKKIFLILVLLFLSAPSYAGLKAVVGGGGALPGGNPASLGASGTCLQSNGTTNVYGACAGGAAVSGVTNSDGTLTISPTTGAVVASIALGHANTWTGVQTFGSPVFTGTATAAAITASGTLTLSAISGSTQCLQVNSSGVISGTGSTCGGSGGSGTVNSGTQYQLGYYAATGTAISGGTGIVTDSSSDLSITGAYQIGSVNALRFPTSDTTAGASIAIGASALSGQTSSAAYGNTAVGYQSLNGALTTAAIDNTAVGFQAGTAITTGNKNVIIGYAAGSSATTNVADVAVGYSCSIGTSNGNTCVGGVATASGGNSTAFGRASSATGSTSLAMGFQASTSNTNDISIGPDVTVSGANTISINATATSFTISSPNSIILGGGHASLSGTNNTLLGYQVGSTTLTTGSNNILIGTSSTTDTNGAADTHEIAIGGAGLGSNTVEIGLSGTTTATTLYGTLTANGAAVDTPHVTFSSSVSPGFSVSVQASPATVSRTAWTIKSATIIGALNGGACSAVVDVWKVNAGYPTVSNTITASDLPALSSATNNVDTTLSGWTTSVSVGDVFIFNVQSNTCDNLSVVLSAS